MTTISDEEFEASIERYHRETYSFRQMLDNRAEEEIVRDDYVLDQHSRGKRMKVVLRKASKKLKLPELSPDSPNYPDWIKYYDHLLTILVSDMRIEAYYKNKMDMAETKKILSENDQQLREIHKDQSPPE